MGEEQQGGKQNSRITEYHNLLSKINPKLETIPLFGFWWGNQWDRWLQPTACGAVSLTVSDCPARGLPSLLLGHQAPSREGADDGDICSSCPRGSAGSAFCKGTHGSANGITESPRTNQALKQNLPPLEAFRLRLLHQEALEQCLRL